MSAGKFCFAHNKRRKNRIARLLGLNLHYYFFELEFKTRL